LRSVLAGAAFPDAHPDDRHGGRRRPPAADLARGSAVGSARLLPPRDGTVAAERPGLVRRLVLEDVGILQPRPAAMPPRPEGTLPLDWRVVEQVRPEIDDPDAAGATSSPGSRHPRW
jgi:hypothetical protein